YTGDLSFVKETYEYIKKGINWLLVDKDQNNNTFPEGYGIMEVLDLNKENIDVAVYTQQALRFASTLAGAMKDYNMEKRYDSLSTLLKKKINNEFWDEEAGSYCDFYGTTSQ